MKSCFYFFSLIYNNTCLMVREREWVQWALWEKRKIHKLKIGSSFITLAKDKELDAIMTRFVSLSIHTFIRYSGTRTMPFLGWDDKESLLTISRGCEVGFVLLRRVLLHLIDAINLSAQWHWREPLYMHNVAAVAALTPFRSSLKIFPLLGSSMISLGLENCSMNTTVSSESMVWVGGLKVKLTERESGLNEFPVHVWVQIVHK